MKKITKLFLGTISTTALVLSAGAFGVYAAEESTEAAGEVQELVVAIPATPKPFNYQNDAGELEGFEVDMLKEIDERDDSISIVFEVTEFDSMFAGLDADRYDLIIGNISKKPEREEKYLFLSEPYFKSRIALITIPDNTEIQSIDDLGGKKVPAGAGRANALFMEAYNEEHTDNPIDIQYTDADASAALVDLYNGRYDACIYNTTYVANVTKEYGYEFNVIDIPNADEIEKAEAWILFAKDDTELRDKFDADIAELKEDGTLSEISIEYFGEDFIPQNEEE